MGVAPGTITSVKSNQAAPSTNYGPLIQSMTQGSAKNLKGYNDQIDNALKGANDMYAKILGLTTGSRDTQTELAKQQEASRESDIQQRMAATGLGNSTVLPSLLTQQQQVGNLTMNDINQKARQDQINAMMPQIQTQIGLKQGKANTNLGYNPTNTQLLSMLLPMIQGGSAGAGGTNLGSIMSLLGR